MQDSDKAVSEREEWPLIGTSTKHRNFGTGGGRPHVSTGIRESDDDYRRSQVQKSTIPGTFLAEDRKDSDCRNDPRSDRTSKKAKSAS